MCFYSRRFNYLRWLIGKKGITRCKLALVLELKQIDLSAISVVNFSHHHVYSKMLCIVFCDSCYCHFYHWSVCATSFSESEDKRHRIRNGIMRKRMCTTLRDIKSQCVTRIPDPQKSPRGVNNGTAVSLASGPNEYDVNRQRLCLWWKKHNGSRVVITSVSVVNVKYSLDRYLLMHWRYPY